MSAGATTAIVTDASLDSSHKLLVVGYGIDKTGVLSNIVSSVGTATIYASVAPTADWKINYIIVG
jgi:hypothetical protein